MLMKFLLEKLTEDIRPQLEVKNCLHFKNRLKSCTICEKACPHGAITTSRASIKIDEGRCKSCGSCLSLCPSQAISLKGFELDRVIREARQKPCVIVGCQREENKGNLTVPCLNGINTEAYVALMLLSGKKEIYLKRAHCSNCENMKGEGSYDEVIERAKAYIQGLGLTANIIVLDSESPGPVIPPQQLTRRELFGLFRRETNQMAGKALDQVTEEFMGKENQRELNRRYFLSAIQSIKDLHSKTLPQEPLLLANWKVNSFCDGCGLCQGVCPGQAWQVKKESPSISVSHHPGRCMACGLCKTLCPRKAIESAPLEKSMLQGFYEKKKLTLRNCSQCGATFFHSQEQERCHQCEKEKDLKISRGISS